MPNDIPINTFDAPITIQDIVVSATNINNFGTDFPSNPTGEYGYPEAFGGLRPRDNETKDELRGRLCNTINELSSLALNRHRAENYNQEGKLLPGKENNITRVVTNEFFFYTKEPMSLLEFQKLQEDLAKMAKQLPGNIHLILGSFAVKTEDNKVMNVVAQIECGESPRFQFTVKNHPSVIDPVYTMGVGQDARVLPNIDIENGDDISKNKIEINGVECHFDFNNVLKGKTADGAEFHSCIDICNDHGLAKKNLEEKLATTLADAAQDKKGERLATQMSHVYVSNTNESNGLKSMGTVTHADPRLSKTSSKFRYEDNKVSKMDIPKEESGFIEEPAFGTMANIFTTKPVVLDKLPQQELAQVNFYNQNLSKGNTTKKVMSVLTQNIPSPTSVIAHQSISKSKEPLAPIRSFPQHRNDDNPQPQNDSKPLDSREESSMRFKR